MRFAKSVGLMVAFFNLSGCGSAGKSESQLSFERRWATSTLERPHLGFRMQQRMVPIVFDAMIIQGNGIDGIVALSLASGREVWRFPVRNGVEGGAALEGGILYFGAGDGNFYSINASTGKPIWSFPIRSQGLGAPVVSNNVVYYVAGNSVAYALEASSGKQLWLYNRRDPSILSIRGSTRPLVKGRLVYFGFSDGSFVALNRTTGAIEWERVLNNNKRFRDVDASPILEGDRIFVSSYDGQLYCLNALDGTVIWSLDDGGYFPVSLHGGMVYYSTTSGKVLALQQSNGRKVWEYSVPRGLATQPIVHRDLLLFGETDGPLRALDLNTGKSRGHFHPGWGSQAAPVVVGSDGVLLFSAAGNLFRLEMSWFDPRDKWPWERRIQ